MSSSDMTSSAGERVTGRVKWFNNKRGFGFITALNGDEVGVDVFAHHSAITTSNEQFLYLVQGEYVDFDMNPATSQEATEASDDNDESASPRWEASNITGFGGGKLMCETRHEARTERRNHYNESHPEHENDGFQQTRPQYRRQEYSGRGRGRGYGRQQNARPERVVVYVDNQRSSSGRGRGGRSYDRTQSSRVSHQNYY
jgi:CspA family cold shock protein